MVRQLDNALTGFFCKTHSGSNSKLIDTNDMQIYNRITIPVHVVSKMNYLINQEGIAFPICFEEQPMD